jgi:hypothetical protein
MAQFYPKGFEVDRYFSADAELGRELNSNFYPVLLIIDRDGKIRLGDIGAPLPASEEFHDDCKVDSVEPIVAQSVKKS